MIEPVITLYKNEGETPLECLERFRAHNPEYENVPLSYMGRLDPMASGILLVIAGEENKNREKYLGLPKEYDCEILFGVSTDTYDVLGLVDEINKQLDESEIQTRVKKLIPDFVGMYKQTYPPFSSKTVDGTPLFQHSRNGTIDLENLPSHEVRVSSIDILSWSSISADDLQKQIEERIYRVSGDFRQDEILETWEQNLKKSATFFPIIKLHISASSGFYVRTFAHELGKRAGIPALALTIVRTKIGEYTEAKY